MTVIVVVVVFHIVTVITVVVVSISIFKSILSIKKKLFQMMSDDGVVVIFCDLHFNTCKYALFRCALLCSIDCYKLNANYGWLSAYMLFLMPFFLLILIVFNWNPFWQAASSFIVLFLHKTQTVAIVKNKWSLNTSMLLLFY